MFTRAVDRLIAVLVILVIAGTLAAAEPPQAPPVIAEPPQAPALKRLSEPPSGYAEVLRLVMAGETVITSEIPGEPKGQYRCWLGVDGNPKYEAIAAPAVAAKRTFPNGGYHAGHNCPNCGRPQFVISGGSKYGTHSHTCPSCGTTWNHR